ncbi:phosphatase PAP2 family protein [Sphingomonas solaris]|nr:phosphatase PAP2 family protein [Sphingomonas solaris]
MNIAPAADTTDEASWALVAIMAGLCLVAGHGMGFTVSLPHAIAPALGLLILAAGLVTGKRRNRPRLAAGAAAFLQMTLFTIIGVVLAYVLAARTGPLWDGALAAADARLGLDWAAIHRALDDAPALVWLGGIAYNSLVAQMVGCIVLLAATGRLGRLRLAVAAAIASGIVTILISGAMPAMGNLFDPAGYHRLWPSIAWLERDLIAGLRDGSARVLDLGRLMGIVSFPSYHATLPVILAWGVRDVPWLRVAAPVWAGLTILATPVFGGHYAVDVIAGLVLAAIAIRMAPALVALPHHLRSLCRRAAPYGESC